MVAKRDRFALWILEKWSWCHSKQKQVTGFLGKAIYRGLNRLGHEFRRGLLGRVKLRLQQKKLDIESDPNSTDRTFQRRIHKLNSIENVFIGAFQQRFIGYFSILLGGLLVMSVDYSWHGAADLVDLQIYGLLFDIVGAILLARSAFQGEYGIRGKARYEIDHFVPMSNNEMIESSVLIEAAYDSIDSLWGVFFLVFGFGLQIVANL